MVRFGGTTIQRLSKLGASAVLCAGVLGAPVAALAALHSGDKIAIVVYAHPELSSTATLDANGNVSLPVAGTIHAEGLEPDELATAITRRLSTYVRRPAVDVQLSLQNDAIFVSGGPGGILAYRPGETLSAIIDALQLPVAQRLQSTTNPHDATGAQGGAGLSSVTQNQTAVTGTENLFDGPVDYRRVTVLRDRKMLGPFDLIALRSSGDAGLALAPNDTIQLRNKPVAVRVEGQVLHPGIAYLDSTDALLRALDQVGGPADVASQTDITLTRNGTSASIGLGSAEFSKPAVPGDRLIVNRAPRVDVLGTVTRPGETYLRGNQTLVGAIYYAGGPAQYANLKAVQVLRNGVKSEYNLAQYRKGHGGDNPPLLDGDVVFVPQGSTLDAQTIFSAIGALGSFGFLFRP